MAKAPATTRPRTAARVAAVQALFQSEQAPDNAETVIDQFVCHRLGELPGPEHKGGGGFEEGRVPEAHVKLFGRIVRMAVNSRTSSMACSPRRCLRSGRSGVSTRCCARCCAVAVQSSPCATGRRSAW